MTKFQKISLFLLRVAMGWLMFYAAITKILSPNWSAANYLQSAKTFAHFYQWLSQPNILPIVDFLNEWGVLLIGISLILGIFVRLSSISGAMLMILYYFPVLDFPYPNSHSFLVDEHVIYALVFLTLASFRTGKIGGIENWCSNLPICSKFPKLRDWLG